MTECDHLNGTIAVYMDRLSGADPEPGVGTVAALTGGLAAALVTMATNRTLGKERYAVVQELMTQLKAEAEDLRIESAELMTLDSCAREAIAEALRLFRETNGGKKERSRVLQSALMEAAEVPLAVLHVAAEVARLSLSAAQKGSPHAVYDAAVAVVLADAAAQSAALDARMKMAWVEDEDFLSEASDQIETVLSETTRLRDLVLVMTRDRV